jgi:hypothetical protein
MAKIRNPVSFAKHFGIAPSQLKELGVFNPTLNVDTKLFIDPLLIRESRYGEFKESAADRIRVHFEKIIKLLAASSRSGDIAWRAAKSLLTFPEISGTCLGYGAASIHGSAWGPNLTARVLGTAKEIVDLGINDPDLFILLPLLEDNMGPDRISDMITNIILLDLAAFTERVLKSFPIKTTNFKLREALYRLPVNPFERIVSPVFLVPTDILKELPVASDWDDVADAASHNQDLRNRVNQYIGSIWQARTRREKAKLRVRVLSSKQAFETLLEIVHSVTPESYDFEKDPEGLLVWRRVHDTIATEYPLPLTSPGPLTIDAVYDIVQKIVEQFRFLIEERGLAQMLWFRSRPHKEKVAQLLFFAVADSYCKTNNLDITPEADTGVGTVDFKFSTGYKTRVLIETKLSTNPKLVPGYERQIEAYKLAEGTKRAMYLVIDVGQMGNKVQRLFALKNKLLAEGKPVSDIFFVDGTIKPSASKR